MIDYIYGNFQYCYNSIPVIRGYCSSKSLIKLSKPHPAYQRQADDYHVAEIKEFLDGTSYKFMPEIILSYDYSGMFVNNQAWNEAGYLSPFDYLSDDKAAGIAKVWDYYKGIEFQRLKTDAINKTIRMKISTTNPLFIPSQVFNRIDGNHRLQALELESDDYIIPFCIILLSSNAAHELLEREKIEMEIFHNINSKVKPLTPIEQYKGLFKLFTVSELLQYGKEFSLTKAYLEKYYSMRFTNIKPFLYELEEIVLFCIKYLLNRKIAVTEDDIADVFSKLEYTYFADFSIIRNCKSRYAIVPYVYYCIEGGKQKNAKLSAYNAWFIKNRLYNVKDFDPASMIEIFNSIYEIRQKQIFVAMPFKDELDFVYKAICDTVDRINTENGLELLKPVRIDKQIVGFSYDIVKEIMANIKNAGLLIADLTYQNANVYYEAGYAIGLLEGNVDSSAEILYLISNPEDPEHPFGEAKFDVTHYKMIPYKNVGNGVDELKRDIEKELKAFYSI